MALPHDAMGWSFPNHTHLLFVNAENTNIVEINSAHEKVSSKANFDKLAYGFNIRTRRNSDEQH